MSVYTGILQVRRPVPDSGVLHEQVCLAQWALSSFEMSYLSLDISQFAISSFEMPLFAFSKILIVFGADPSWKLEYYRRIQREKKRFGIVWFGKI